MDDVTVFFRYEYRARSIVYIIGSVLAICVSTIFITVALYALFVGKTDWTEQLFIVAGSIITTAGATVGVVGIWCNWIWRFTISTKGFHWSTPRQEESINCADVVRVRITTGEWDRMSVETRDGRHHDVPSICLGNLEQLCREIHQRFPNMSVIYNHLEL
jgi:hypothetical protein